MNRELATNYSGVCEVHTTFGSDECSARRAPAAVVGDVVTAAGDLEAFASGGKGAGIRVRLSQLFFCSSGLAFMLAPKTWIHKGEGLAGDGRPSYR